MSVRNTFPQQRPTLNLNFANSKTLDPRITFTRTTTATYVDEDGLIKIADADVARFDHDPITGECLGLLVEEQRTNQIRNNTMQGAVVGTPGTSPTNWTPINRSNLTWSIVGAGIDSGVYYVDLKLSGTANATSSPTFTFEFGSQISASNGQTWSTSCFIKLVSGTTNGITQITLSHDERSQTYLTGGNSSNFLSSINSSTTNIFSSCRYSFSRTNTNASTTFLLPYLLVTPTNGATIDMTLRIGMPQTELGSFSTTVIPTVVATVTRTADNASITGTNFSDWYNQSEGTFNSSVNFNSNNATHYIWQVGNIARRMLSSGRVSGNSWILLVINNNSFTDNLFSTYNSGKNKWCASYSPDGFFGVQNGGNIISSNNGDVPTLDINILYLGSFVNTSNYLNGHISKLTYYPTRLSNSQLQNLTK